MDMIKLYDFKSSPNCQRVKVVLAEKNLPYETVPIDLRKQEQKTPEYLKMNPYARQIPGT
jgi:glutathione S-transferase